MRRLPITGRWKTASWFVQVLRPGDDGRLSPDPGTTASNAILYLKQDGIQYFEAEFTAWTGSHANSWGWYYFGFGGNLGSHALNSGAALCVPAWDGFATLVRNGKDHVSGGDSYKIGTIAGYDKAKATTWKVRVLPGSEADEVLVSVWAKVGDAADFTAVNADPVSVIDANVANGGYIFLQTQNDDQSFDNLVIRPLNAEWHPAWSGGRHHHHGG